MLLDLLVNIYMTILLKYTYYSFITQDHGGFHYIYVNCLHVYNIICTCASLLIR